MDPKPIYKRTETWLAVITGILQVFSISFPESITAQLQQFIFYAFASTLAMVGTTTITEFTYNLTLKLKEATKNGGKPWYKKTKFWIVIAGAVVEALVIALPDKFTPDVQQLANQIILLIAGLLTGHTGVDMSNLISASKKTQ